MKQLVLRFDIDTFRCIREGMPNLLRLAREQNVRFTFFCNMGRAISRRELAGRILSGFHSPRSTASAEKLSSIRKLGPKTLAWTLLLNPKVGTSCPAILRDALADGHDLGLHGGRNHGTWQHGFKGWKADRIKDEVTAGKALFESTLGIAPTLFSSPGWQGSDTLNAVLRDTGFKASADRHGPEENDVICKNGFCTLPTNLIAEPGGVAYFESLIAKRLDDSAIVKQFEESLSNDRKLLVLYDHPCLGGTQALDAVRGVVQCAIRHGVQIVPYSALLTQDTSRDVS